MLAQKKVLIGGAILDIEPKTNVFFFDSLGLDSLKHFIIQDDQRIIKKYYLEPKK